MYNSYSMFYDTLNPYIEAERKKLIQKLVNTLSERIVHLNEENNSVYNGSDDDSIGNV